MTVSVASPPQTGLNKKKRAPVFFQETNVSPYNAYVGENFIVHQHQWFKIQKLIMNTELSGIAHCDFIPTRNVDTMSLTEGAVKIRDVPNAGGNSVLSEVMSFEMINKCFGAKLVKTEMEVTYFPTGGSITDYVCQVYGQTLGVSVTRAMKYRGEYLPEDAYHLLCKKLKGIVQSSRNTQDKWSKQILHVWATNKEVARIVEHAYESVPEDLKVNTMVLVTTATESKFIFLNAT